MRSLTLPLSILCAMCLGCAEDGENIQLSGKRKIAHTPYQTATLRHVPPAPIKKVTQHSVTASVRGTQSDPMLQSLTAPMLLQRTQKEASSGMIAAGWPGQNGKKGEAKPAQKQVPQVHPSPSSQPSAHPTSQPSSQPMVTGGVVHGEINLKPELATNIKAGSVLFVIVRRHDAQGGKGMMIAATKIDGITAKSFPLRYAVTQKDAMMGAPLVGKVSVTARVDQDGDAISKQPGDVVGAATEAVMVGTNPVKFTLDSTL